MVKKMKGLRVGRGHEMTESVLKKDNHCLGGENKQIPIEIYLLPVEITIFFFLCFSFMFLFSDLVILALTIIVGLIFFSLKGSKF